MPNQNPHAEVKHTSDAECCDTPVAQVVRPCDLLCSAYSDEHDRAALILACTHAADAAVYTESAVHVFADPNCALTSRVAYDMTIAPVSTCHMAICI